MSDTTFISMTDGVESRMPPPRRRGWLRLGLPLVIVTGAVLLLLATGWEAWRPHREVTAMPVGIRTIEVAPGETPRREGRVAVQAPGWVESDPFEIYVSALTHGVVEDVKVLEGDRVSIGEEVATLVADEARLEVDLAEARLIEGRGLLERARAVLAAAEVDRRELVALDRRVAIAAAQEAKSSADLAGFPARRAALEAARGEKQDEYDRKSRIVDSGAVSAGAVERLRIRIRAMDAQIDGLDSEEAAVKASLRAATAEHVAAVRARELLVDETLAVESAQAGVLVAEGQLAAHQTALESARLRLDRCSIKTPVDGVVIERLTSPGSMIGFGEEMHGAHVIHVYDPEKLQVRADIPLADAAGVGVGQQAEIVIDLLPDTVFRGVITRFVHRADLAKNTVEAKVAIIDPSPLLKPDMLARVRILETAVDAPENTMPLRTESRVFAPPGSIAEGFAWVVEERRGDRGVATRRPVEVGERTAEGWIEVLEGLRPGDLVIMGDSPGEEQPVRFQIEGEVTS